jgi:hypothetical protein
MEREVFDWGFQKTGHKIKDLVTSFVTNGGLQEELDQVLNENKQSTVLSESQNVSKNISEVT